MKNRMGKKGKHGRIVHGFVVHGIDWTHGKVFSEYRKRFAIESSYRIRNIVRTRTSTRDPTTRYLYAIISLLLKNVWVALQWKYFTWWRRGPRTVDEDRFRFDDFRLMVWDGICRLLKIVLEIPVLRYEV